MMLEILRFVEVMDGKYGIGVGVVDCCFSWVVKDFNVFY